MVRFVVTKVTGAVVTLVLAVVVAFLLSRLAGDPVGNLLGPLASRAEVRAERHKLGLDQPLLSQLWDTFVRLLHGDFGTSLRYGTANYDLITHSFPATFNLAMLAMALAVVIGLPVGAIAALRPGSILDRGLMSLAVVGQSLPMYWLGMLLVLVFSLKLGWLPAGQDVSLVSYVLPALTLCTAPLARIARLTRSSMTRVLGEDYVDAARSRGLSARRVVMRHVIRNAALPVVTMIGLQTGGLLSGVVTVEAVFAWPGIGNLAVNAVSFRDFSLVEAIVIFGALIFVVINLIVDVSYGIIDPRVRGRG